jgi:hypothetical protein
MATCNGEHALDAALGQLKRFERGRQRPTQRICIAAGPHGRQRHVAPHRLAVKVGVLLLLLLLLLLLGFRHDRENFRAAGHHFTLHSNSPLLSLPVISCDAVLYMICAVCCVLCAVLFSR